MLDTSVVIAIDERPCNRLHIRRKCYLCEYYSELEMGVRDYVSLQDQLKLCPEPTCRNHVVRSSESLEKYFRII